MFDLKYDRSTHSLEVQKSLFFDKLIKFIDTLYEYYPLILNQEYPIKKALHENEIVNSATIGKKFDLEDFNKQQADYNAFMDNLDENIFKPLERQCLELNIFWYNIEDEDYNFRCDFFNYQKDIVLNTFYLYDIDPDFDMIGKIRFFDDNLLEGVKDQIGRYLKFRKDIFFCSHKFSRMLLCFDDFLKEFIYKSNFNNSHCEKLHLPLTTYMYFPKGYDIHYVKHFYLKIFYSHVLPKVVIEKKINVLIDMFNEMDKNKYKAYLENGKDEIKAPQNYNLITEVYELEYELDDYLIEQIEKNQFFFKGIEYKYFIDDLIDLLDVLKSKLLSRKQKRFVDDFSKKLIGLIDKSNSNKLKLSKEIKIVDFFFKGFKSKSGDLLKEFSDSTNRQTAILIYLLVENKIITIERKGLSKLNFSNFIQNRPKRKNIAGINSYFDSSSSKKIALNDKISEKDEDFIKLKNSISHIFNLI